jgi:hypothetical protein
MSSGGGPRAKGTDGSDHKFRQRVNSHYTLMALGRTRLGLAVKLHAAHFLAAGLCAAAMFATASEPDLVAIGAAACSALSAGLCAVRAGEAAKGMVARPAERYTSLVSGATLVVITALAVEVFACVGRDDCPLHAQLSIPTQLVGLLANVSASVPAARCSCGAGVVAVLDCDTAVHGAVPKLAQIGCLLLHGLLLCLRVCPSIDGPSTMLACALPSPSTPYAADVPARPEPCAFPLLLLRLPRLLCVRPLGAPGDGIQCLGQAARCVCRSKELAWQVIGWRTGEEPTRRDSDWLIATLSSKSNQS